MICVLRWSATNEASDEEMQRQRSRDAEHQYMQRRHISQDDTISVGSVEEEGDPAHTETPVQRYTVSSL